MAKPSLHSPQTVRLKLQRARANEPDPLLQHHTDTAVLFLVQPDKSMQRGMEPKAICGMDVYLPSMDKP